MQVVVLAGGLSPEREVSIRSGRRIAGALRTETDFEVIECDIDASLVAHLTSLKPDCVVPVIHGAAGEDGSLQGVLQALGLTHLGSPAESCRLAFDKPVAKALIGRSGAATPPALAFPHSTFRELGATDVLDAVVATLGLPLIVKPTKGGSALGAALARQSADLPSAMVGAFAYSEVTMMEKWVDGVEIAVSVIDGVEGPQALPIIEIVPAKEIYDYSDRYTAGTTEFFIPARVSEDVASACADLALLAHRTLGLRDWSRTDLIVDRAGTPWFLEVNVAPGMTETSLFPQAIQAAGLSLGEVTADLIRRAVQQSAEDRRDQHIR